MFMKSIAFVLFNKVGTAQRNYPDIAMASSGSPPRSAFATFATVGASDLEQEEQANAAPHAAIPTPASPTGSAGQREARQEFDIHTPGGPGNQQEVLRQLAGFTVLLQQMRQEAEAVQRKVTDLEKLVVPGADPLPDS